MRAPQAGLMQYFLAAFNPVLECSGTGLKNPFSEILQPITGHFLFSFSLKSRGLTSAGRSCFPGFFVVLNQSCVWYGKTRL